MASSVSTTAVVQTGLEAYAVNNVQDGTPLYIGKVKDSGDWVIQKYDSAAGTMGYANLSNNLTQTSGYGAAWAARTGLTFDGFETLTGV